MARISAPHIKVGLALFDPQRGRILVLLLELFHAFKCNHTVRPGAKGQEWLRWATTDTNEWQDRAGHLVALTSKSPMHRCCAVRALIVSQKPTTTPLMTDCDAPSARDCVLGNGFRTKIPFLQ